LLFAAALAGAQAQPAATETGAQAPGSPSANGNYFGSRLVPPKSEGSCPPNIGPMYQADAIVTGTDMRQRPWGFAQTLREVLVKSSGDPRLKDDPRTAQLAVHADRFVACFDYVDMMAAVPLHDDQGTSDRPHKLTVYFIPAEIDALLAQFGDKPWRGERPIVVPILLVHGRKPPPYVMSHPGGGGAARFVCHRRPTVRHGCARPKRCGASRLVCERRSFHGRATTIERWRGDCRGSARLERDTAGVDWKMADALARCRLRMGHQWRQLRRGIS